MKARITITLKNGVLDPQGKAIEGALHALGFAGSAMSARANYRARAPGSRRGCSAKAISSKAMCEKLLANTVIENYDIEIR